MKKANKIIFDTIINIFLKSITFVFALLISKLIIKNYGSSTNGLFSLITQVFTYVSLLEAGIGNATQQLYFKSLTERNYNQSKVIFNSSIKSYKTASFFYFIFSILLSLLIPFMSNSSLSYYVVVTLAVLQGIAGCLTFVFLSSYKNLMISTGDYKISNIFNSLSFIIIAILKILFISMNSNILFLQAAQIIGTLVEIVITINYCQKKYTWLKVDNDETIELKQRKAFLIHEISGAIFSSTDVITLSIICGLEIASIYSVYNIIYSAIASVAAVISTSIIYYIGSGYNKNKKEYYKLHDRFECIYIAIIFAIVTSATMICIPFIRIYTKGITDTNYVLSNLPIMFALIQILTCGRSISNRLIGIAGYAKQTQYRSVLEAFINIVCSIVLTIHFGIYGVLLGTIIATVYRTFDVIIYTNRKIIKRHNYKIFVMLAIDFCLFFIFLIINNKVIYNTNNYASLIIPGIICGLLTSIVFISINILIYFKNFISLIKKKNI